MTNIAGVNVPAGIRPFTTDDSYDTHDALYGKGGWRSVPDVNVRDNIPLARRTEGMVVYVVSNGIEYVLGSDLTTWTARPSGGTSEIDFVFTDEAERDAYFVSNPGELVAGIIIALDDAPSGEPQTHSVDATLAMADLNATHYLQGAVEITLPEITQHMVDMGMWVRIYKDTTSAVNILAGGTDLIVDADNLGETSSNADMFVELMAQALGVWKIGADRGEWASV